MLRDLKIYTQENLSVNFGFHLEFLILPFQVEVISTLIYQSLRDKTGTPLTFPPNKYISVVSRGSNNGNIHLKQVQEREVQIQKLFRNQRKPNVAFHS